MTTKPLPNIVCDSYGISIDDRLWECWTAGELLDLTDRLGTVRFESEQRLATDSHDSPPWVTYRHNLAQEVGAYRALGHLRLKLKPGEIDAEPSATSKGSSEKSVARIEFELGCELAAILPDWHDSPDPDGVIPRA